MRLEPTPVEHPVQGKLLKFYPLSLRMLFKIKSLAQPVLQSLAVLFSNPRTDSGSKMLRQEGVEAHEILAIDPALAEQRYQQHRKAIQELVEALFEENNGRTIALLILDSLREEYPDFKNTDTEARDFLHQRDLTIDIATELLVGVVKANKGVLDPLGIPRLIELVSHRFGLWSPILSDANGPDDVTISLRPEATASETPGSDSET